MDNPETELRETNAPKRHLGGYLTLFAVAGLSIWLDEWSQFWVRDNLAFGETLTPWPWLAPYARLVHWGNDGAAFGLFKGSGGGNFFALLAIVVAALIIYYFPRIDSGQWLLRVAMGLQLGGALGNLLDRLTLGYVTDFISVGNFPVFNVADASITVGVGLLLLFTWFGHDEEDEASEVGSEQDAATV
ncbi:MAG: signal peptidase II [Chloroflexi bacterium]|nr:signal peptidase II [Chloroflexota bacterium]